MPYFFHFVRGRWDVSILARSFILYNMKKVLVMGEWCRRAVKSFYELPARSTITKSFGVGTLLMINKKALYIPSKLGGVWMVGVKGYIGPTTLSYCSKQGRWNEELPVSATFHFTQSQVFFENHPSLIWSRFFFFLSDKAHVVPKCSRTCPVYFPFTFPSNS
jgi:hypothetical protein